MSHSLRLLLSQWFFGSSGPGEGEQSGSKRLLLFTLLVILSYGPVWLAFRGLQPLYRYALAIGMEASCSILGKNISFLAEDSTLIFSSRLAPAFEADLAPEGVYANMVFLIALLLVTPGMRPKRRALAMVQGAGLLYLSHLAFLMTKVQVSLNAMNHSLAGHPAFWNFWDDFFEIMGRGLFPILIWLLLAMPYMLGASDRRLAPSGAQNAGRNAPCPCGSGKKYKICCGRT